MYKIGDRVVWENTPGCSKTHPHLRGNADGAYRWQSGTVTKVDDDGKIAMMDFDQDKNIQGAIKWPLAWIPMYSQHNHLSIITPLTVSEKLKLILVDGINIANPIL